MAGRAVIVAARRTAVAPRGGAFKHIQADQLAAPVLQQLLQDAQIDPGQVDQVLLGNALYGGGNPARRAALRAGLPVVIPALTIDTQCCAGLDAIQFGARLIEAGAARCVIAGGMESYSRAPIRMHRPVDPNDEPVAYERPSFAPPPFSDPDLTEAAAGLAADIKLSRKEQAAFAVKSHEKARAAQSVLSDRMVVPEGAILARDAFTRPLTTQTAARAKVLAGAAETGLTSATIACEADAAAAVLLVSEEVAKTIQTPALQIREVLSGAGLPAEAALTPIALGKQLLERAGRPADELDAVEVQESYAVQAMVTAHALKLQPKQVNRLGGALARGHPIGASGAILAVHLYQVYSAQPVRAQAASFNGMALIAAAGGLSSGLFVQSHAS